MSFFREKFGLFIRNPYLCNLLLLIIGAFGRQSSMRCVTIISRPESSLFGNGVTPRSGLKDEGITMTSRGHVVINMIIVEYDYDKGSV